VANAWAEPRHAALDYDIVSARVGHVGKISGESGMKIMKIKGVKLSQAS
jgi:hypothetical protein